MQNGALVTLVATVTHHMCFIYCPTPNWGDLSLGLQFSLSDRKTKICHFLNN